MIRDGFAGPGGWAEGLRMLGLSEVGMEWDRWACATRVAAGHRKTIRCDVSQYPTAPFAGRVTVDVNSPPCQPWSKGGKRLALVDQPLVHQAVADLAAGRDTRAELKAQCKDPRSILAAEPMRWHHDLRPETILLEQVPDVLPLWKQYAQILRGWGYTRRPAPTVTGGGTETGGAEPFSSTSRAAMRAAMDNPGHWAWRKPAPTVTGTVGHVGGKQAGGHLNLSPAEAAALQSFPAGHPFQGNAGQVALQIGNAVPPLLAAHIAAAALGLDLAEHLAALAAA